MLLGVTRLEAFQRLRSPLEELRALLTAAYTSNAVGRLIEFVQLPLDKLSWIG